jgi:hypothetical protein
MGLDVDSILARTSPIQNMQEINHKNTHSHIKNCTVCCIWLSPTLLKKCFLKTDTHNLDNQENLVFKYTGITAFTELTRKLV